MVVRVDGRDPLEGRLEATISRGLPRPLPPCPAMGEQAEHPSPASKITKASPHGVAAPVNSEVWIDRAKLRAGYSARWLRKSTAARQLKRLGGRAMAMLASWSLNSRWASARPGSCPMHMLESDSCRRDESLSSLPRKNSAPGIDRTSSPLIGSARFLERARVSRVDSAVGSGLNRHRHLGEDPTIRGTDLENSAAGERAELRRVGPGRPSSRGP